MTPISWEEQGVIFSHNKKIMKKLENTLSVIVIIGLVCMLLYSLTSCARKGYGCHGRGRIITRVPSY
jgi:hypothetical protein